MLDDDFKDEKGQAASVREDVESYTEVTNDINDVVGGIGEGGNVLKKAADFIGAEVLGEIGGEVAKYAGYAGTAIKASQTAADLVAKMVEFSEGEKKKAAAVADAASDVAGGGKSSVPGDGSATPESVEAAVSSMLQPGSKLERPRLRFEAKIANTRGGIADDVKWHVQELDINENLSWPYEIVAELSTDAVETDLRALSGADLSVCVVRGEEARKFYGVIESVQFGGSEETLVKATVTAVPAFALLQKTKRSRIFEKKTVPDILKVVLEKELEAYGRTLDLSLLPTDPAEREYCVQYDESDFAFASRLMEEEGYTYCFVHGEEDDAESMVIMDCTTSDALDVSTLDDRPVSMLVPGAGPESVMTFVRDDRLVANKISIRAHDWTSPNAPKTADEAGVSDDDDAINDGRERMVYLPDAPVTIGKYDEGPGRYQEDDSQRKAARFLQRERVEQSRCTGTSRVAAIGAGYAFELINHANPELNGKYLVVEVRHTKIVTGDTQNHSYDYENEFECIPLSTAFIPSRMHKKPKVQGIQTARVSGPSGELVHTDAYGRVKVHFHWDSEVEGTEANSCWIRVQQAWAGAGWGQLCLPHIGMEVIVSFINGDPDRPVITGCLYNGENLPPYALPDEKMTTSLMSCRGNEFRFKDVEGEEEVYLHAQKNLVEKIENNQTTTVLGDQSLHVEKWQKIQIDQTRDITVNENEYHTVEGDRAVSINGGLEYSVNNQATISYFGGTDVFIDNHEKREVKGGSEEKVTGDVKHEVIGKLDTKISSNEDRKVGGKRTTEVTLDDNLTVTGAYNVKVTKAFDLQALSVSIQGSTGIKLQAPEIQMMSPKVTIMDGNAEKIVGAVKRVEANTTTILGMEFVTAAQQNTMTTLANSIFGVRNIVTGLKGEMTGISVTTRKMECVSGALETRLKALFMLM